VCEFDLTDAEADSLGAADSAFGTPLGVGLREGMNGLAQFNPEYNRLARAGVDPSPFRELDGRKPHGRTAHREVVTAHLHSDRERLRLRCRNLASEFELTVRLLLGDVADIWLAVHANPDSRSASLDVAAHNHRGRGSAARRQEDDGDESRGAQKNAG
jgi:hypothetical protein